MSVNVDNTLLDRINTDPDLRRALSEASTPADRKQILVDAGIEVDEGELERMWPQITSTFDIPDEELDQIAGGVTEGVTQFDHNISGA